MNQNFRDIVCQVDMFSLIFFKQDEITLKFWKIWHSSSSHYRARDVWTRLMQMLIRKETAVSLAA